MKKDALLDELMTAKIEFEGDEGPKKLVMVDNPFIICHYWHLRFDES